MRKPEMIEVSGSNLCERGSREVPLLTSTLDLCFTSNAVKSIVMLLWLLPGPTSGSPCEAKNTSLGLRYAPRFYRLERSEQQFSAGARSRDPPLTSLELININCLLQGMLFGLLSIRT